MSTWTAWALGLALACTPLAAGADLGLHARTESGFVQGVRGGMPAGAYHTADVQYLFDVDVFPGPETPEQVALSEQMMRYWAAFAARSRPASEADPEWPAFTDAEPNVLALRPEGSALRGDFAADHRCAFWDSL